ncbi:MAG: hydrogenase nickel incorporation protein HypB [Candidatus Sumerlaeia bacterium]|nr:hydrogenase nickel incorporation protein HypB [Candidatus Sumerlaeia bacterium]
MEIKLVSNLLKANEALAQQNRRLFDQYRVGVLNIMSSPGAGKTTVLEKTLATLGNDYRLGVIEGDVASDEDSQRLAKINCKFPVQIAQINTINLGGACHLDANMLSSALSLLNLNELDLLFIENVGNLICPAEFNLGEDYRVVILSVPEGDDKPLKYPLMFRQADVLLLNKIDLLPHTPFNRQLFLERVRQINARTRIFEISAITGEGLQSWYQWLYTLPLKPRP